MEKIKVQNKINSIDDLRHQREEFMFLIGGSGNNTPAVNSLSFNQRQKQDILISKINHKKNKTVVKKRQSSAFKSLNRSQKNGLKVQDQFIQDPSQAPPAVGTYRPIMSQVEQNNVSYTFGKQMKFIQDKFDFTENSITAKEIKMAQFSNYKLCTKVVKALDNERCEILKDKAKFEIMKQASKNESKPSSVIESEREGLLKTQKSFYEFKEKVLKGKKQLNQDDLMQIHFGSQAWKKRPFSGINQIKNFMNKSSKARTKASSNIGETSYQVSQDYTLIQSFPERFIIKEELEDQLKGKSLVNFGKQMSRDTSVQPTQRPISSYSKQTGGRQKTFSRAQQRLQSAHNPIPEQTKEFKFNTEDSLDEEPHIKTKDRNQNDVGIFDKEIPLTSHSVNQVTLLPKKRIVQIESQMQIKRTQTAKKSKNIGGLLMSQQISRENDAFKSQERRKECQPEYEPKYDQIFPNTNCYIDFNKMKKGREFNIVNRIQSRLHSIDSKSLNTSFSMLAHHKNFAKQSKRVIDIGVKGELRKNIERENENLAFIQQFKRKK